MDRKTVIKRLGDNLGEKLVKAVNMSNKEIRRLSVRPE